MPMKKLATFICAIGCCVIDFGDLFIKLGTVSGIMAEKIVPVIKADEEAVEEEDLVDPQETLKEECSQLPAAQNQWSKFQECNDRVNSRSNTAETCEEELIDYLHIIDKCVVKDLFKRLK
ncbi:hypothetical protein K1T71_011243 [Dendrolimus kikuchii]|uniref:Uncharacterized protein n=1 Tax=Dendrolimus kikuchii TaxID=765133 RepID=A0ACC1CNM4_9NEOP|nr:hypothetical protein K1T71_011243 [Dendrolimus kikuchii]